MISNPHRIEVTIDRDGHVTGVMKCDAPHGAPCRLWCLHDCETADDEHEIHHQLVDQGRCIRTDGWFDEIFDTYSGEEAPLHSGPVDLIWESDFYSWRYSDDATTQGEALAARGTEATS